MPNGLIHDDSLRAHPDGLALRLTIPWYRSLWLSSVTTLALTVDGEQVDAADLRVEFGDASYALDELPAQSERLWFLQEHPLLIARRDVPVARGETHDVVLHGELRLPYMQIAPGQDGGPGMYVPTSCTTSARSRSSTRMPASRPWCRTSRPRRRRPRTTPSSSA